MTTIDTTATATATKTRTARTARTARKTAPRVEQLAAIVENAQPSSDEAPANLAPSHADVAIAIAEGRPVPTIDPAIAERLAALEAGQPLPASGKGLPPVVKMNELGALARQLHRAVELLGSEEVFALADALENIIDGRTALVAVARLRDEAMRRWRAQFEQRAAAGAADNDTLHPLGLVVDDEGRVQLEKKPAKSE